MTPSSASPGPRREPARYLEALSYRAPFLIEKLLKEQIVETAEQGEALFAEVLKYLILNRTYPGKQWEMVSRLVDEVWHQFVLFTREYHDFGERYFGHYLHHAPGNSPSTPPRPPQDTPSFDDFGQHYQAMFGAAPPALWHDPGSVTLRRRVVLSTLAAPLTLVAEDDAMVTVMGARGPVVTVSELARDALAFMLRTRAFYVRELPGELTDDEKVGLVEALIAHHLLLLAS